MSALPSLAIDRLGRLRQMHRLADGAHRQLQGDRMTLQSNLERVSLSLTQGAHEIVEREGRAFDRHGRPRPDRDHFARDVAAARAARHENSVLLREAGQRSASLRAMVEAAEQELRARGWRQEP